ncbi:MAG: hypothetical protein LBR05_04965, partial [Azoarcus sp.]|nr:hypothetical protein [Azoarcus sp.]
MAKQFYQSGVAIPVHHAYLERPRVDALLAEAVRSPVVVVCAGAGYGKTRAVYNYLRNLDGVFTAWVQLSERDNLCERFWENFTHTVAHHDAALAAKLAENGFPRNEAEYEKYVRIPEEGIQPHERHVVVYDDFHLLHDKDVLRFIERCVHTPFPNIVTIFISRTEPAINLIDLFSKGMVVNITENELRFTENELAEYLRMQGLAITPQGQANIYADTEGWAFAINLVALSLKKNPTHEGYARAAMRLNIFRLLESEVFLAVSERLQKFLVRLSLIDHL